MQSKGFPGGPSGKESTCQPMQYMWVQSLGWEDTLEQEMARHSNSLAWKIPWAEESSKLQSTGPHRAGHD